MPSAPMSVKSDRPMRPGGCSWRKITSRLGPLRARHLVIRRSNVRRTPGANPGISTANLLEDGHRADAGGSLQHRHDLPNPLAGKRVGTAASTRGSDRRWRSLNPAFAAATVGTL